MRLWIIAICVLISLCTNTRLQATHIVGGELTYTCLGQLPNGNNEYELKLTVFRDCFNGIPYFDDPAHIGVYDINGVLVDTLMIDLDFMLDDTLSPELANPCLVVPPDVCVHTVQYTARLELPFRVGGYELIYQRCCRNRTINNIVLPDSTGATFSVTISELAFRECNSSAVFNDWPPIYICANEPIDFDQSAVDIDGDSIVYKLCTPNNGATVPMPYPTPSRQTVPQPVVWLSPPYGINNMLNGMPGGEVLAIDPQTGFLTGIPNTVGQFVVGICLEEYRNGQLISTTRRDFQYNVGICGETVSSFFKPEIICEGLTVSFENESVNADDFLWFFGDTLNPFGFSMDKEPTYTFSDTGTYNIMLIAEPGNLCVDSFIRTVTIQEPAILPFVEFVDIECSDSLVVQFVDSSRVLSSDPVSWFWEVERNGMLIDTSQERNPVFVFFESGTYNITMTIKALSGCVQSFSVDREVSLLDFSVRFDTLILCEPGSIRLNSQGNPVGLNYLWSPDSLIQFPNQSNPLATVNETTLFNVMVSDTSGECAIERTVLVIVPEPIQYVFSPDTFTCDENYLLTAASNQQLTYTWATDPGFDTIIGIGDSIFTMVADTQQFYLEVKNSFGCTVTENFEIIGQPVDLRGVGPSVLCQGDSALLTAFNLDSRDTLTYDWGPSHLISRTFQGGQRARLVPVGPGLVEITVNATNQYGCTALDTIQIRIIDTLDQSGFISSTQCGGFTVQFTNTSLNAGLYTWYFGDPTNPDANSRDENPSYTYSDTGTYQVTLILDVPFCPDTIQFPVQVEAPQLKADFDWSFTNCGDSAAISFTNLSQNNQANSIGWYWSFSNGDTSTQITPPDVLIRTRQDLEVALILFSGDGCSDTIQQVIPVNILELDLMDTLVACPGVGIELNPMGDTSWIYQWFPAAGLDDPNSPNPLATPTQTTTYTTIVTDAATEDTCRINRQVTVIVPPPLSLEVSDDQITCDLTARIGVNTTGDFIRWSRQPDFSIIFSNEDSVTVNAVGERYFYVEVGDTYECTLKDSILVRGNAPAVFSEDVVLCAGDTTQLQSINQNPSQTLSYDWSPRASIIAGATTPSPFVVTTETTDYIATITNDLGCTIMDTVRVSVTAGSPVINLTAEPDTIIPGDTTQLSTVFNNSYTYLWSPDENMNDPLIFNPLVWPLETTTYTVVVTDVNGCTDRSSIRVTVREPECETPVVFIPNAFSPNNDGENDFFEVYGWPVEELHLVVYNRWGQKVFETFEVDGKWDGRFKGKALAPDVFGYYAEIRCVGGATYFKKGNVTLLK